VLGFMRASQVLARRSRARRATKYACATALITVHPNNFRNVRGRTSNS